MPESIEWQLNGTVISTQNVLLSVNATTVAGGNGTGAGSGQFQNADRIFVDATGIIYVADQFNNRVQKWLPGAIAGVTVAGGNGVGAAPNQLNRPSSVFVDDAGNVFIADQGNGRVQKWVPGAATGITVAGGSLNVLSYPTDLFVDKNGVLYVSDQLENVVVRFSPGANFGIVVAGDYGINSGASGLNAPTGIYVDQAGNIYICDTDNYRLQKWAPGASSGTTVTGSFGYRPLDVAVDCSGNIYVAEYMTHQVLKYPPGSSVGTTVAGNNGQGNAANQLNNPVGVFIVGNNYLYVADYSNHRVQRFSNSIDTRITPMVPGTYTVTANYACCPSTTSSIKVIATQNPETNITASAINICPGDLVTFTAANTNQIVNPVFKWLINGSKVGDTDPTFKSTTILDGDKVTCILGSDLGCTLPGTDTSNIIEMTVTNRLPPALGNDLSICRGKEVLLQAQSTYSSYRWQDNSTQPALLVNRDGRYHLQVTDACNNIMSDTITVSFYPHVNKFLPSDTIICSYDNISIRPAKEFKSYEWNNFSTSESITVDHPGLYWLQGTDENNCINRDSIIVVTKNCPPKGFYIGNAFSPNNDNRNDVFKPVILGTVKNYQFSVYDRYGSLIFNSSLQSLGWNGTSNSKSSSTGVYIWLCKYEDAAGVQKIEKGTVVLVR